MTQAADTTSDPRFLAAERRRGWIEAGCFVMAITVLNIAYWLGHQVGADPVVFIVYAMLTAASALLLITGPGSDWRAVIRHPLSWIVGIGIIGMEASYYMLLRFVTPAEGSILNRINLPASILAGWLLFGRRTSRVSLIGIAIVVVSIGLFMVTIPRATVTMAITLGVLCALISMTRNFAAEYHPWNRRARDVLEKMRITGLVLIVTSFVGTMIVAGLMALVALGVLPQSPPIPRPEAFLHVPTIGLGLFMGAFVLTAMQYFGFSSVVRIGTERFIAAGTLVPATTLIVQNAAAFAGLLPAATVDGTFLAVLLAMIVGVYIYIAGGRLKS